MMMIVVMVMSMPVATFLAVITVGVVRICVRVFVAVSVVAVIPLVVFLLLLHFFLFFKDGENSCVLVCVVWPIASVVALLLAVAESVQTLAFSICRCDRAV